MGRRTFESIGKPLPNRFSVILSGGPTRFSEEATFVNDRESAQFFADIYSILKGQREYFIVGGGSIYDQFVDFIDKIYLTEVFAGKIDGDSYFNWSVDKRKWKLIEESEFPKSNEDQWPYRFAIWQRKQEHIRTKDITEFMTNDSATESYVRRMIEHTRNGKARNVDEEMEQALLPFLD